MFEVIAALLLFKLIRLVKSSRSEHFKDVFWTIFKIFKKLFEKI